MGQIANSGESFFMLQHVVKMLRMQIVISASDGERETTTKKSLMNYDIGAAVRAAHHYVSHSVLNRFINFC